MGLRSILVTGAEGFVGRHLMPVLAREFPRAELHAAGFDVTDRAAVAAGVRACRPDACVHLAAIAAIPAARKDPDRAWSVNLHGTLDLARSILTQAPDCALLFVSSADAYGASFRAGVALDEHAPLAPLNVYAATKAAADLALGAMAAEGLRVVRLRPFNQTGPGQSADYVVAAFARQVARIEAGLQAPRIEVGALDPCRDFLDVRDACAAYASGLARARELAPGTVLNIASGTPRRVGDILDQLLALAGVRAEVASASRLLRRSDIALAAGDAAAARRALDWAPRIPWQSTLRDVLDDWRRRAGSGGAGG